MIKIRNRQDLELAYTILRDAGCMASAKPGVMENLKREIRTFTQRSEEKRKIIHENGIDSYTVLIKCPDDIHSKEDAEEWFESEEKIYYRPTYYDCTGQAFTGWHKIIKRRDHYYCYHQINYDV